MNACDGDCAIATAETTLQQSLRADVCDRSISAANMLYDSQEYASRAPNLNEARRANVMIHLRQVRQKYEHQIPASRITKGKFLNPNCSSWISASGGNSEKPPQSSQLYFFSMPYFLLDSLAAHHSSDTSDIHPMRTLIQL